jgi:copper homeostasis protein
MITLEIACNSWESCISAVNGGADRIELFENLPDGGCTPSAGLITMSTKLSIPVYVMIRPRGGDFCYSKDEIEIMKTDIAYCKQAGIKGIVFGCLTPEGEIDTVLCKELLDLWGGAATFHRAIDDCLDIHKACQTVVDLGFERILSSGGSANVMEGLSTLSELQNTFGNQIKIMPGAGITADNAAEIIQFTGCKDIHATCKSIQSFSNLKVKGLFLHRSLTAEITVREIKTITLEL